MLSTFSANPALCSTYPIACNVDSRLQHTTHRRTSTRMPSLRYSTITVQSGGVGKPLFQLNISAHHSHLIAYPGTASPSSAGGIPCPEPQCKSLFPRSVCRSARLLPSYADNKIYKITQCDTHDPQPSEPTSVHGTSFVWRSARRSVAVAWHWRPKRSVHIVCPPSAHRLATTCPPPGHRLATACPPSV
jgi:hypothetical protein